MGHGPATFKETDLTRTLRAARKAGDAAAQARGRPRDILAAPRVKDIYQFALQEGA
jgi:hypothetical protein